MHDARCTMHSMIVCISLAYICVSVCMTFGLAHKPILYRYITHRQHPFSFLYFAYTSGLFFCSCMHLNGDVPFFLVNTLALVQIISFLNVASNADVWFSLEIIHAIHDIHRTNNRQTEKLRWRHFFFAFFVEKLFFLKYIVLLAYCRWCRSNDVKIDESRVTWNMHVMWMKRWNR